MLQLWYLERVLTVWFVVWSMSQKIATVSELEMPDQPWFNVEEELYRLRGECLGCFHIVAIVNKVKQG